MHRHLYVGKILVLLVYGFCLWITVKLLYWGQLPYFLKLDLNQVYMVDDIGSYSQSPISTGKQSQDLLDKIDIDCDGLRDGNNRTVDKLRTWHYTSENVERDIMDAEHKCAAIKKMFTFPSQPYSREEADFPLAYGILIYKEISQVLFMLSAFYHPQNEYCLAVSGSAEPAFKNMMRVVGSCFPNVIVLNRPKISWGAFEIINSTYACMEVLAEKNTEWKYFQYLSGVDIPLRTNLEMVRVFKAFNNTVNAEVKAYQNHRANNKSLSDSPLPLYKSSLSATMPRTAVNVLVKSREATGLLAWLRDTDIPDEAFWGTVAGSPHVFPLPGGYNATAWLEFRAAYYATHRKEVDEFSNRKVKMRYYLSRYQVWHRGCAGKMKAASCVFGLGDYSTLRQQPHLVAHKLYLNFEPATFFCMLKEIRERTLNPVSFDTSLYRQLPQVELQRGISWDNLTHPTWLY